MNTVRHLTPFFFAAFVQCLCAVMIWVSRKPVWWWPVSLIAVVALLVNTVRVAWQVFVAVREVSGNGG